MKLLLKKSQGSAVPNWHPNFRNATTLPDLKLIRTSFFVNAVFVTIALGAVLLTIQREYASIALGTTIEETEARIAAASPRNNVLLTQNREFTEAARKITEARDFTTARFATSGLIVALGRSLPDHMDFSSIILDGSQLVLRGTIRGASDSATDRLSQYLDVLRQDSLVGPEFSEISLNSFVRDPRTQGMVFEVLLKKKAEPPAKPANPAKP